MKSPTPSTTGAKGSFPPVECPQFLYDPTFLSVLLQIFLWSFSPCYIIKQPLGPSANHSLICLLTSHPENSSWQSASILSPLLTNQLIHSQPLQDSGGSLQSCMWTEDCGTSVSNSEISLLTLRQGRGNGEGTERERQSQRREEDRNSPHLLERTPEKNRTNILSVLNRSQSRS